MSPKTPEQIREILLRNGWKFKMPGLAGVEIWSAPTSNTDYRLTFVDGGYYNLEMLTVPTEEKAPHASMFFASCYSYETRHYEVAEACAFSAQEAFEKIVIEYNLNTTEREAFTVNCLTDKYQRAANWAQNENAILRAEWKADEQFEEMAYGIGRE